MAQRSDHEIEAARRQLRNILTRRDFLAAASVGTLGLAGCSSDSTTTAVPPPPPSSPGTIPSGFQAVTGSVSLPAGSTLKLTDMTVDVLTQGVQVSTTGGFTVGLSPDGPALALLLDKGGDGVLVSVLDPATSSHTISTHTTAVALLYFATGAHVLPANAMSPILALLNGDPAIAALDAAVAAAVVADPHALANNAAPLGPAITQALQTILGSPLGNSSVKAPATALRDPVPTLLRLTPTDPQNGVTVNQDATTTSLLISNAQRRPCKVYVYEISTLTGTTTVPFVPAKLVAGPFDLDSTESLGLYNALKDFFHGASPWTPVSLPAIPLALDGTSDRTDYQVVMLAASAKALALDTFEPAFMHVPAFATALPGWQTDYRNLFFSELFGDMLLPVFCFFGGLGAMAASRSVIKQVGIDAAAEGSATFKSIIANLESGSLGQLEAGLAKTVQDAVNSQLSTQFWKPKVRAVVSDARKAALDVESLAATSSRLGKGAKMFQTIFEPILAAGVVLDGIDFLATIHDVATSDLAATWDALLIRQLLNLSPQLPTVSAGDRVSFGVSNPQNTPAGIFEYDWTQSSLFATLSAVGEANVGNKITTSKLQVDLLTTGSDVDPINLLVIGYDTSSGTRKEIGRAGTTVKFLLPAQILPANAAVERGEQRLFSVTVGGTPPSGIKYKWTLTGPAGSIGDTNVVITTVPQINYTGLLTGTDNLHVDVLDLAGNLVAKADAAITVAAPSFIQYVAAGNWPNGTGPVNGSYSYTDFKGGRVANAVPGLDAILFIYDLTNPDADGVTFSLAVPAGQAVRKGETFAKQGFGQSPAANLVQLLLLVPVGGLEGSEPLGGGGVCTGTLTIDNVSQLLDGTFVANYSFNFSNGAGATLVGSGVGRWM